MYKSAIKKNSSYVVPFIEGIKYYGSDEIEHALATMIIVNKHGDILTCKHVANDLIASNNLINNYKNLLSELKKDKKGTEKKYKLDKNTIVLNNVYLPFNINGKVDIEIKVHKSLDLALIKLKGINIECNNYPIFSKTMPEQGQSVCKLGYAFPEYSYYEYKDDNIVFKKDMVSNFPLFPMDGIVTRHVIDENNVMSMFETSTPGLRGQSGGPVFSPEGIVYGIQTLTKHIDLNFDVDTEVKRGVDNKRVTFTPFINLGVCVSSKEVIKFLDENKVEYQSI